jgi:hypothetical protein
MASNSSMVVSLLALSLCLIASFRASDAETTTNSVVRTTAGHKGKNRLAAEHKSEQHKHSKKIAYSSKRWFVPPPPAYTPSMLPEMHYAPRTMDPPSVEAEADQTPYSKYIYTRSGYDAPRRVQPNKYVTYWGNKT